jgi:hypothetical protein
MTIVEALRTADAAQATESVGSDKLREALIVLAASYRDVTIGELVREEKRRWMANPQRTN